MSIFFMMSLIEVVPSSVKIASPAARPLGEGWDGAEPKRTPIHSNATCGGMPRTRKQDWVHLPRSSHWAQCLREPLAWRHATSRGGPTQATLAAEPAPSSSTHGSCAGWWWCHQSAGVLPLLAVGAGPHQHGWALGAWLHGPPTPMGECPRDRKFMLGCLLSSMSESIGLLQPLHRPPFAMVVSPHLVAITQGVRMQWESKETPRVAKKGSRKLKFCRDQNS